MHEFAEVSLLNALAAISSVDEDNDHYEHLDQV